MSDFQTAVNLVLKHEGGYTTGLPNDPGGETNWGISKRSYPDVDIKNLTRDGAIAIYQRDYWKPFMEQELDQRLANAALDCAVNQGPSVGEQFYLHFPSIREFQLARLLRYANLIAKKPADIADAHSWFERVLDV